MEYGPWHGPRGMDGMLPLMAFVASSSRTTCMYYLTSYLGGTFPVVSVVGDTCRR